MCGIGGELRFDNTRIDAELGLALVFKGTIYNIKAYHHWDGEGGKYLKQIATGLLPDKIINRPKGYFPLPH